MHRHRWSRLHHVNTDIAAHWDDAYASGDTTRSWYQPQADMSLRLIAAVGASPADALIDIGGGASTLVDGLLADGCTDVTVLDISTAALAIAQQRLGQRASQVHWLVADILTWRSPRHYRVWHDRAVLHFMTTEDQRSGYREAMMTATAPGSTVVLGTFGPTGPTACSGLPVHRGHPEEMVEFLGDDFDVQRWILAPHLTPAGATQQFLWTVALRV